MIIPFLFIERSVAYKLLKEIQKKKGENAVKITLSQAKNIIESEGLDFKEYKDEITQEVRMDIIDKKGMFNEIINDIIIKNAEDMLLNSIPKANKQSSSSTNDSQLKLKEDIKGED